MTASRFSMWANALSKTQQNRRYYFTWKITNNYMLYRERLRTTQSHLFHTLTRRQFFSSGPLHRLFLYSWHLNCWSKPRRINELILQFWMHALLAPRGRIKVVAIRYYRLPRLDETPPRFLKNLNPLMISLGVSGRTKFPSSNHEHISQEIFEIQSQWFSYKILANVKHKEIFYLEILRFSNLTNEIFYDRF